MSYVKQEEIVTCLVDCIKFKPKNLDKVFENHEIVKIMHSSLSNDIGWLQRDFNIQVINVFDV
jgi:ribonuclease D